MKRVKLNCIYYMQRIGQNNHSDGCKTNKRVPKKGFESCKSNPRYYSVAFKPRKLFFIYLKDIADCLIHYPIIIRDFGICTVRPFDSPPSLSSFGSALAHVRGCLVRSLVRDTFITIAL